jgi:ubiquinone/menaquinone biosynthesis C-methylase UbiE
MSLSRTDGVSAVFDRLALWRAEIIKEFRLRGAERCAAASPTPGFPQLFDSLRSVVDRTGGRWLDVGGGLGGTASWVERTSRATVIVVDPAESSLIAARQLFPSLVVAVGSGTRLPVADGSIDVVLLNGVASLLDDLDGVAEEVRRVATSAGRVLVTDLWSASSRSFEVGPNRFHSIEAFASTWARHHFVIGHVAVADTSAGWWSSAARQINDEIVRRHSRDAGFDRWYADLQHLDEVMTSGDLVAAGLVLDVVGTDDRTPPGASRAPGGPTPGRFASPLDGYRPVPATSDGHVEGDTP